MADSTRRAAAKPQGSRQLQAARLSFGRSASAALLLRAYRDEHQKTIRTKKNKPLIGSKQFARRRNFLNINTH